MTYPWFVAKIWVKLVVSTREVASMTKPRKTPTVPIEFAGKWIAWNFDETRIIASGRTYQDTLQQALATGEAKPILEKAPDARVRFIGGLR